MKNSQVVYVVEDDAHAAALIVKAIEPLKVRSAVYTSAEAFLQAVAPTDSGCVVLDLNLPTIGGNEVQRRMTERGINLPVLIISGADDVAMTAQSFRFGAVDYLQKPFQLEDARQAIAAALELDLSRRSVRCRSSEAKLRIDRLSAREREVFELLVSGQANKQVALTLGLSVRTVEVHRARIMQKLDVDSFAVAVRLWMEMKEPQVTLAAD